MDIAQIVAELDKEISRLQHVRSLLGSGTSMATGTAKRGRPKGSVNKTTASPTKATRKKRKLSPEGRKAIADAMKRRWAERRKAQG